jgi:hypothetical protein
VVSQDRDPAQGGAFETKLTIDYKIHELYYGGLVNKTGLIFKDLKDVEWKTNTS